MTLDTEPDLTTPWKERDKIGKAEIVRHLLEKQGLTSTVAAKLLGTTRNAIVGVASRFHGPGVSLRGGATREQLARRKSLAVRQRANELEANRRRRAAELAPKPPKKLEGTKQYAPVPDKAWQPLAGSTPKPLHEHRHGECLWPLLDHPILFCCLPVEPNHTYCPAHRALGFRPNPGVRTK